jgi:hypothetical protein
MAERQPNHVPHPNHAPQEGGNSTPGIAPSLNERAKPPPEGSVHGERHSTNVQQPLEQRGAVFECATPKVRPSPYHLRLMVRDRSIREDQAQEAEREWRENLRTWDRPRLEKEISSWGERRDSYANHNNQLSVQGAEDTLEALRSELRQRE